jgi:hypothetical protein
MTLVLDRLRTILPHNAKTSPSGWISFNAPCCHHKGHKPDDRKRGGVMFTESFVYNCFNCKFTAYWEPGRPVSEKLKNLCKWMGASDDDIKHLIFEALKTERPDYVPNRSNEYVAFEPKELPPEAKPISWWINCPTEDVDPEILPVLEYMASRGLTLDDFDFYWSPDPGYKNRLLIPFRYHGKIVGWTGRKITAGKPKYLTDAQPGYVFNIDQQTNDRQYIIVVEGQFDAIAVDGVAIMHNEPNETQAARINTLGKEIIVVPDRDKAGSKMIRKAIEYGWSVSLPPWEYDIKDVADAVKRYGRLYTLYTILHYKESNSIKLQLLQKKLEHLND